jgi:hypothetical protein
MVVPTATALKRRGVLVVLGVEPRDRPDGLFDMVRAPSRWLSGFRVRVVGIEFS